MTKVKVKSREEKTQEEWLKYFKNIELKRKLDILFRAYIKDVLIKMTENTAYHSYVSEYLQSYYMNNKDKTNMDYHIFRDLRGWDYPYSESNKLLHIIENKFKKYFGEITEINKEIAEFEEKQDKINYFTELTLKNFKGFSENNNEKDNTINIKPITLIYGPNSYGKSSILQSLLLLNQTINEGEDYEKIHLLSNGKLVKLGSFQDFLNKNAKNKNLKIEITLPYQCYDLKNKNLEKLSFGYGFSQDDSDKVLLSEIDISKKTLQDKEKKLFNRYRISSIERNTYKKVQLKEQILEKAGPIENIDYPKTSFFTIDIKSDTSYDISMYDEAKNLLGSYEKVKEIGIETCYRYNKGYSKKIFESIEKTIKNIIYVSSYRTPPERYFVPENNRRVYVGKNGEFTAEILGYDLEVRKYVDKWLDIIAGYKLSFKKKNENVNSINLNDSKTEINNINLLDLGSGIAQILPIITQAFKSENDMILIEEPEIHLHPKAQADLGEMFAHAAKEKNNTFIIETHSENLLLRLEKLIRHGELSKDDVSVIYVNKNETGSHCIPLILDDEGDITNINDVPNGFFEEGFDELFDINKDK